MNKIKICHIAHHITGLSDGVFTHLKSIIKYLPEDTYDQILIYQGGKVIEDELRSMGVSVYIIPEFNKTYSIKCLLRISSIIFREKPDILQSHTLKPYILSGIVNVFTRRRHIFNYHGLFIDNIYYNVFEKTVYRILHSVICKLNAVDLAIVPSFASKDNLKSETKLFKDVQVYYNGINTPDREELITKRDVEIECIRENYKLIIVVGRLERQKRIDRVLILTKLLLKKRNDFKIFIYGDGPLIDKLNTQIMALNLQNKVYLKGYYPNILGLFKYFDLLLFTSDWEGFPMTIWEAMGAGLPVVAPDVGGIREILNAENCGIVYSPADLNDAVDGIELLLNNEEHRNLLGKNGQMAVEIKYSMESFINTMRTIYQSVLQ